MAFRIATFNLAKFCQNSVQAQGVDLGYNLYRTYSVFIEKCSVSIGHKEKLIVRSNLVPGAVIFALATGFYIQGSTSCCTTRGTKFFHELCRNWRT